MIQGVEFRTRVPATPASDSTKVVPDGAASAGSAVDPASVAATAAALKRVGQVGKRGAVGRSLKARKVRKTTTTTDKSDAVDKDLRDFQMSMLLMQSVLRMAELSVWLRAKMVKRCLESDPAKARVGVREIRTFGQMIMKTFDGFDEEIRIQLAALRKGAKRAADHEDALKRLEAELREWQVKASGFKARQERLRKEAREEV